MRVFYEDLLSYPLTFGMRGVVLQLWLIATMFVGRLGSLTITLWTIPRDNLNIRYPKQSNDRMRNTKKRICVIGLGQFGSEMARKLAERCDVLALDLDENRVNAIADDVQRPLTSW